jgi:hypothetical protein
MEISSPPYPREGFDVNSLYNALVELRTWVQANGETINDALGEEVVPTVEIMPAIAVYRLQPVLDQGHHWLFLRSLREEWDHLVRIYEESWDCPACMKARAALTQSGSLFLRQAFVPFELREARQDSALDRIRLSFERLADLFHRMQEPSSHVAPLARR